MLPIERDVSHIEHFDPGGSPALSLYLDTDTSRGVGRNLRAQVEDVLRPIRSSLNGDTDAAERLTSAAEAVIARIPDAGAARAIAAFVCPDLGFLRIVPLPGRKGVIAHWGPELLVKPLVAAMDEHERTLVVLVDQEHAHVFRVFLGQIEEVAHFTDDAEKHGQGGYSHQKSKGGIHGGAIRMGYGEPNLQRRHEWHVRRHLERVVAALRPGSPAAVDRVLVCGGEVAVYELLRLLPKRIRDRTRRITGIPVDATAAKVLARVIEAQREAEREQEEELMDNLTERDRPRSVFGAVAVAEAVSDARVHTLVYCSELEMEGSECTACGWIVPGAPSRSCPRCGVEMRGLSDLVEQLVARVIQTGGRIEEVRGPARRTLMSSGGLAALLRYVPTTMQHAPARLGPQT